MSIRILNLKFFGSSTLYINIRIWIGLIIEHNTISRYPSVLLMHKNFNFYCSNVFIIQASFISRRFFFNLDFVKLYVELFDDIAWFRIDKSLNLACFALWNLSVYMANINSFLQEILYLRVKNSNLIILS